MANSNNIQNQNFNNFFHKNIEYGINQPPKIKQYNTIILDGSKLTESNNLKTSNTAFAKCIIICSILFGLISILLLCFTYYLPNINSHNEVANNLSKQANYNIPQVSMFLNMSNDQIDSWLDENSLNYINMPSQHDIDDEDYYDIYKIPNEMNKEKARTIMSKGFSRIDPNNASYLFNGGWELDIDRSNITFARVRYVDFTSKAENVAIQNAKAQQGFTDEYITDSGVDELGNTYISGTAKYNDEQVAFRLSALPLSEIYKLALPDDAIYIGIKIESK